MLRYTHVFYLVLTVLFVLIFIKPKRIKELWAIAVLSIIILMVVDICIVSLKLYQFNNPLVNVLGAPLFHLLWAGPAGIVFIYFMKPGFTRKFVTVIFFTIITLILDFIAEKAGVASRLGGYNILHSTLIDFASLVTLLWISEGLYGNRIYSKENAR